MKLNARLGVLAFAATAALAGCRSTSPSSTVQSAPQGLAPSKPGAAGAVVGYYAENGMVFRKSCQDTNCTVTHKLPVATFKHNLTSAYENTAKRAMTAREKKVFAQALEYVTASVDSTDAKRKDLMASNRFASLLAKFSAVIDQAFNTETPTEQQNTALDAGSSGASLAGQQFLNQTMNIVWAAPIQTTPIFILINGPITAKEIDVELAGCNGWRVNAVKIAKVGNPVIGTLAKIGPAKFASNFGGVMQVTHIGFDLVPNPLGQVPVACNIRAFAVNGGGGPVEPPPPPPGPDTTPCDQMEWTQCIDNNDRCTWSDQLGCTPVGGGGGGGGGGGQPACPTLQQASCDDEYPRCRWSVLQQTCLNND